MIGDKRTPRFAERFSKWLLLLSTAGAALVLLNPEFQQTWSSGSFHIGGGVFSDEIRGAVVTLCIIGAITALIRMWLPGNETPPPPIAQPGTLTSSTTTEVKQ